MGRLGTPQLQAHLFWKTNKAHLFPKRLKPKTMPRNPALSLSVFWSPRLLRRLLFRFRLLSGPCVRLVLSLLHSFQDLAYPSNAPACISVLMGPREKELVSLFPLFKFSIALRGSRSPSKSCPFPKLDWQDSTSPSSHIDLYSTCVVTFSDLTFNQGLEGGRKAFLFVNDSS